jgi:hypothetical protein
MGLLLLHMGVDSGGSEPGRFVATRQLNSNFLRGASYDISVFVFNMFAYACLYLLTYLPQVKYAFLINNDQRPSLNCIS